MPRHRRKPRSRRTSRTLFDYLKTHDMPPGTKVTVKFGRRRMGSRRYGRKNLYTRRFSRRKRFGAQSASQKAMSQARRHSRRRKSKKGKRCPANCTCGKHTRKSRRRRMTPARLRASQYKHEVTYPKEKRVNGKCPAGCRCGKHKSVRARRAKRAVSDLMDKRKKRSRRKRYSGPKIKKAFGRRRYGRRRFSRRRSYGRRRFGMKPGTGKGGMGPGYRGITSYPNVAAPYFGSKEPWVNASNWWYPVADGKVQSPQMLMNY